MIHITAETRKIKNNKKKEYNANKNKTYISIENLISWMVHGATPVDWEIFGIRCFGEKK